MVTTEAPHEHYNRVVTEIMNRIAPSDRFVEVTIGFLLLAAATATVFITFKGTEYTDDRWPTAWWLPLFGGLALAAWLADHALGYLAP